MQFYIQENIIVSWKRDSYHLGHYDKRSKTGRERQILFLSLKCGLSKEITNTETENGLVVARCWRLEGGAHYQGKDDQKAKLPVPKKYISRVQFTPRWL